VKCSTVHRAAVVAAVVALVPTLLSGRATPQAQPAPLPDVQKLGPQVGDHVPDFALLAQHGRSRTLASLMGRRGLMLVFFRSADW